MRTAGRRTRALRRPKYACQKPVAGSDRCCSMSPMSFSPSPQRSATSLSEARVTPSSFDRFGWLCRQIASVEAYRVRKGRFRWDVAKRSVGPINFFKLSFDPVVLVRREEQEAEVWASDTVAITIQLRGRSQLEQAGRVVSLDPGDFTLVHGGLPYRLLFEDRVQRLVIRMPIAIWEARFGRNLPLGRIVRGQAGLGALAATYVKGLWDNAETIDERRGGFLADIALDLLARAAAETDNEDSSAIASPQEIRLHRIKRYILAHLEEPDLTPPRIAAANSMALRSVHAAFAPTGKTVCAWIRDQRLSRCDKDLLDPEQRQRRISDICFARGFNDLSYFARLYRQHFGISPRQRRRAIVSAGQVSQA